jgi:hypothetical protein
VRRQLFALAVAAVSVTALSACDVAFASTFEDDPALKGKITSVQLDDIGSGRVTIRGGAAKATMHRKVKYRGDKPKGITHRIENGVLKLRGCGSHCSVGYTIDLPAGLPVTGKTSSGSINLSHVGAVNVSTDSGAIRLEDVNGPVKARTSDGEIEGRGLKGGGIDAKTSNGQIRLTPSVPQDVHAKTSDGDITVTVPGGTYRVTTHTGDGDRKIGVPNVPSGRYRLDLSTGNGDITAKAA